MKILYMRFLVEKFVSPVFDQIFTFFGIFHVLNIDFGLCNPKKHIPAWDRVVWATARENPSSGLTCRCLSKKGINQKKVGYISRICREAPWTDLHEIWHSVSPPRRNQLCQFFGNRFRDRHSVGVKFCHSPLTQAVAVNTVLRYRAPLIKCKKKLASLQHRVRAVLFQFSKSFQF